MTVFFKKNLAWLPVIVLITVMSFSLASKAESDAKKKMGSPAGTAGYQPDEESGPPLGLPAGTPGHRQPDDAIDVQSHPLSKPDRRDKKSRPIGDLRPDIEENN